MGLIIQFLELYTLIYACDEGDGYTLLGYADITTNVMISSKFYCKIMIVFTHMCWSMLHSVLLYFRHYKIHLMSIEELKEAQEIIRYAICILRMC